MHWMFNVTILALAGAFAFLVLGMGWNVVSAFIAVGGSAAALVVALIAVLMLLANPDDRPVLLRDVYSTMKSDFAALLRLLGIRR